MPHYNRRQHARQEERKRVKPIHEHQQRALYKVYHGAVHRHPSTHPDHKGKEVIVPGNQAVEFRNVFETIRTQSFDAATSLFNSTAQTKEITIESNRCHRIKGMFLRFKLTAATAAGHVVPSPFFVEEITLKGNNGSGDTIQTWYPETLWMALATLPTEQLEHLCPMMGLNPNNFWPSFRNSRIENGETRYYELPLIGRWWENGHVDMTTIKENLRLIVKCRSDIVSSGSLTIGSTTMELVIDEERADNYQQQHNDEVHADKALEWTYLDVLDCSQRSTTVTASTKKQLLIGDNIVNKALAALAVGVRASATGVSVNGLMKFLDLGEEATLDYNDESGNSIYGNGTAVLGDTLRGHVAAKILPSNFCAKIPIYIIPFCSNLNTAFRGVIDGMYRPKGTNTCVNVTPGAAGAAEVQTVTLTNAANDGGKDAIQWTNAEGKTSHTPAMEYNTSAANMAVAFSALPSVWKTPGCCTCTFSGTAAATFTSTFTELGQQPDVMAVVGYGINDGGVLEEPVVSISTIGYRGFSTSSSSNTDVYAFYFRTISIVDGYIKVRDV